MLFRILAQIGYTFLIILEALLSIRFVLKLFNIPGTALIVHWLYSFTDKVLAPFVGIIPFSVNVFGFTLELTTLLVLFFISLASYALYEIIKAYT